LHEEVAAQEVELLQVIVGLIASAAIAFFAYRWRALSTSGAYGAILVGTMTFGFGGWTWGLVLITFFALSTLLSRHRQAADGRQVRQGWQA
jgi:uncharacterized membrane protein